MSRSRSFHYGVLGLFLLLFFLNTVSHDYLCHDKLHTVCGPLHSIFKSPEPYIAANIFFLPRSLPFIQWNHGHIFRPDFIKNIFHPPD
jgi:hypothetical protein